MCAGGATSLAEAGVPPNIIQAVGRWALDTFQIYIRKNSVLLQAMLFRCPAHQPANTWLTSTFLNWTIFHKDFCLNLSRTRTFLFWPLTTSLQSHTLNSFIFPPLFSFLSNRLSTNISLPFPSLTYIIGNRTPRLQNRFSQVPKVHFHMPEEPCFA